VSHLCLSVWHFVYTVWQDMHRETLGIGSGFDSTGSNEVREKVNSRPCLFREVARLTGEGIVIRVIPSPLAARVNMIDMIAREQRTLTVEAASLLGEPQGVLPSRCRDGHGTMGIGAILPLIVSWCGRMWGPGATGEDLVPLLHGLKGLRPSQRDEIPHIPATHKRSRTICFLRLT
jgi:hypothetical protein